MVVSLQPIFFIQIFEFFTSGKLSEELKKEVELAEVLGSNLTDKKRVTCGVSKINLLSWLTSEFVTNVFVDFMPSYLSS